MTSLNEKAEHVLSTIHQAERVYDERYKSVHIKFTVSLVTLCALICVQGSVAILAGSEANVWLLRSLVCGAIACIVGILVLIPAWLRAQEQVIDKAYKEVEDRTMTS